MSGWLPITYRDFYDIPHAIVVEFDGGLYFLDSPFDDAIDDYRPEFTVYRLPSELRTQLAMMSWVDLQHHGEAIGAVPTDDVQFDKTKRQAINSDILAKIKGG